MVLNKSPERMSAPLISTALQRSTSRTRSSNSDAWVWKGVSFGRSVTVNQPKLWLTTFPF
jgi:hypothetical protein